MHEKTEVEIIALENKFELFHKVKSEHILEDLSLSPPDIYPDTAGSFSPPLLAL